MTKGQKRARGRLIVLEGLDGAGTTTQTHELVRRLAGFRLSAHATAEPSKGPIGALIRQILTGRVVGRRQPFHRGALALLFAADRLDHAWDEIVPLLNAGNWVVSDRYVLSSLAYQALDVSQPFVAQANAMAPRPDLTVFLDVPPEVSLRRRQAESASPELFEDLATQRRVARGYQAALKEAGRLAIGPVQTLDGTGSIAAVADSIEALVSRRFKLERSGAKRLKG